MLKSDELLVSSEQELYDTVMNYVNQFEALKKKAALEQLLPNIRWCFISTKFLAQTVEKDKLVCSIPCVPVLLFETYRYKACPQSNPRSYNYRRRISVQGFDPDKKATSILVSEDFMKSTFTSGSWESIRVRTPFSSGYVYCEFKCIQISNLMVGCVVGNVWPFSGYAGQYAYGYCVQNSGTHYHAGSSTSMSGMSYANGDRIGVAYDRRAGKLHYYKNGARTASFETNVPTESDDIFPTLSAAGSTSVTLMFNPTLPSDLEDVILRKNVNEEEEQSFVSFALQNHSFFS